MWSGPRDTIFFNVSCRCSGLACYWQRFSDLIVRWLDDEDTGLLPHAGREQVSLSIGKDIYPNALPLLSLSIAGKPRRRALRVDGPCRPPRYELATLLLLREEYDMLNIPM